MTKKSITAVLLVMLLIGVLSLYTTFAYDEEATKLDDSSADYNLIYSLKENSNRTVNVNQNEEKYIDVEFTNTYPSTVKYGMYYYLANLDKLPEGVSISVAPESVDPAEDTIKSGATKVVSIIINNASDYNIELIVGALIGFENGKTEDLLKAGEVLIK